MPLIALTGGIASGKSTVSARLAEHGAVIVDADAVVRELQAPRTEMLRLIAAEFGDDVIAADGSLRRAELGSRVFGHPERIAALNAIVHPGVRREIVRRVHAVRKADPDAVVVYDVPLLVEGNSPLSFDEIVVVDAPAAQRVERLVRHRGMDPEDARRRVAAQASDEERRAIADTLIDSSGSLADTLRQADELWARLTAG